MVEVNAGDVIRSLIGDVRSVQTVKWVDDTGIGTFSGLCLSHRDVIEVIVKGGGNVEWRARRGRVK